MAEYISQHVALLILTTFMIRYNIPENMIEDFLIEFDTTTNHRLWTRESIEFAKKMILEKYVTQEKLYP